MFFTVSYLPTLPSIPIPPIINTFFSYFPIITYEAPSTSQPAPSLPTLWLLGPPPLSLSSTTSSKKVAESLDPYCRALQSLARFVLIPSSEGEEKTFEVRWMKNDYGTVGGKLPNLHLPDGSLIGRNENELKDYFKDPKKFKSKRSGTATSTVVTEEVEKSLSYSSFEILVEKTLLPALLSLDYFSENKLTSSKKKKSTEILEVNLPYLSSWVAWYDSMILQRERVNEVRSLSNSTKGVLDLEEVERVGIETIHTLEVKFREDAYGAEGWFGGSAKATELDALIYSLLSLTLVLPASLDSQLRRTLESSPNLMAWVKAKKP